MFAFFGLAAYNSQMIERGLINLAVLLTVAGVEGATPGLIDELFASFEPQTFGRVLKLARETGELDEPLDNRLREALSRRNDLVHNFFWDHAADFLSEVGRRGMIDELRLAVGDFAALSHDLDALCVELCGELGVSEAVIRDEFAAAVKRAQKRDQSPSDAEPAAEDG